VRLFLTNDDGGQSPGLLELARVILAAHPQSVVAVPAMECSNFGTSLRRNPDWLASWTDLTGDGQGWLQELGATPAQLVRAACAGAFGPPPDAVIAGVNHGPNVGSEILHSGTIGAVLTAASVGVRAVAVSLDDVYSTGGDEDGLLHWETAAAVATPIIDWISRADTVAPTLSVNVPNRELSAIAGVREARLAGPLFPDTANDFQIADSDIALLAAGYVTVTALVGLAGGTASAGPAAGWLAAHLDLPGRGTGCSAARRRIRPADLGIAHHS